MSAIRIIDQHTHMIVGPEAPATMPPVTIASTLLIALKPGDTRGRYTLRVAPEAPSGQKLPELNIPVNFTGSGEQGLNVVVPLQMQLEEEGLYWFDVLWVDQHV